MKKLKKIQRGFGLLELMLSMVIVALLLIMATRYYQSAHRSERVSTAVQQVNAIIGAANEYAITNGGTYGTNLSMPELDGLLPSADTGNINPWGVAYDIKSSTATSFVLDVDTGGDTKGCTLLMNGLSHIDGIKPGTCTAGQPLEVSIYYDGTNQNSTP